MGGEWKRMPLGDFVTLQRGHDLPDASRRAGQVPILGSFGVTGWHDEAKASGPGVTIGRSGASLGVVSYSAVDFWPLNTALYVVDFHGNDERFAYYFLKNFDFTSYNSGSAQPSLNRNFLHPVLVDVPPLSEQLAIAKTLGELDAKIELNQRTSETLESMARALFKSWFVDFDPVQAKAEGRETGVPAEIAELFPDGFDDSELGEVPSGWRVGRFGDLVELLRDQENPLAAPDEIFQHYSLPAFDEGRYPTSELGAGIKSQKCRVPAGAVLLSKLNPEIERVWIVDVQPADRAVCSTEFLVLRARHAFTRAFVYCLARSRPFRRLIEGLVTGTSKSHQRAQAQAILDIPVVIPPVPLVGHFDKVAEVLLVRVLTCRSESRTLATLRDALLPKLISGELPVGKVNAALGATS